MGAVYSKTDNYGLDLYGDKDPADLRDGHNANMRSIDGVIKEQSDSISEVRKTAEAAAPQNTTYNKTEIDDFLTKKADSEGTVLSLSLKADKKTIEKTGNVVALGIDNSGENDISSSVNELIQSGEYMGLYFPQGTYLLSDKISVNIKTGSSFSIFASPSARFIAQTDNMPEMLYVEAINWTGTRFVLDGGIWDANRKALRCIKVKTNYDAIMRNMQLLNAIDTALDNSEATCVMADNIDIWGGKWNDDTSNKTRTGIDSHHDSQYNHIRVFFCDIGIKHRGYSQFSDIYIYGGTNQSNRITVGFNCMQSSSELQIHDIYMDTLQTYFSADSGVDHCNYFGNGLFAYLNNTEILEGSNCTIFKTGPTTLLNVSGMRIRIPIHYMFSDFYFLNPFSINLLNSREINFSNILDINHLLNSNNMATYHNWTKISDGTPITSGQCIKICCIPASNQIHKIKITNSYHSREFEIMADKNSGGRVVSERALFNGDSIEFYSKISSDNSTREIYLSNDGTSTFADSTFFIEFTESAVFNQGAYSDKVGSVNVPTAKTSDMTVMSK
jgi:hypothetical protein